MKRRRQKNPKKELNALTIRRSHETFLVNTKDIRSSSWHAGVDPIFQNIYVKYISGKIAGYATRVPLEMITEGFYHPLRNFEHVCDRPPEDIILEQMLGIRQGERPVLHLYGNKNKKSGTRFLCSDDVVNCIAYKRLGISAVPAMVFAPGHEPLPYSSIETRCKIIKGQIDERMVKVVSNEMPQQVFTMFPGELPESVNVLEKMLEKINSLIASLRTFHTHADEQLHYHHMIFSALLRAKETLMAIDLLIRENLWYQALSLLRVLYEIHLNFYFDWLQPESNYRHLAAAAVFNGSMLDKQKSSTKNQLISEGLSAQAAEDQANRVWNPVKIASTVAEKAKLPKVGILYHKDIYGFLSQVSHQNFEIASLHANRFDDEKFLMVENDLKLTYLRFMDLIVSEFAAAVSDDLRG